MFKINDHVIYNHEVCKIIDITKRNNREYYSLVPLSDDSLKINIPTDNINNIKKLISKKYALELIDNIKNINPIDIDNKQIEAEYKKLLHSNNHEDLVKIIKTTYLRNEIRNNNKKKLSDTDQHYFLLAEKYLYNELSVVLDMSCKEVKEYIIKKMEDN